VTFWNAQRPRIKERLLREAQALVPYFEHMQLKIAKSADTTTTKSEFYIEMSRNHRK
jgi:hypothetical protein